MTIIDKMKKSKFFSGHSLFAGLCFAFALSAAFYFASCDAGLGESIDTTEPSVSITAPQSGGVVSGVVSVSGTCKDDKAVASVSVSIKNTLTEEVVKTENAAISGTDWTLNVDSLPDGTYSADAICYDAAGRKSGVASRVFDVDNTPPVFCVTKPNSLTITDPAAYGRDVVIKGEIADDHTVKQMDVRVFKVQNGAASEITLPCSTFSGFETAGGTEVTIAKFFPDTEISSISEEDMPLYQNYKAMYTDLGASVGDTVQLYIFPYLTDAAGNKSDKCYIQSSLKQLVSKACKVDTTSDSLQTAQLKKILNGSYSLGEVDVATMKQILEGKYNQSSIGTNYLYYAHLAEGEKSISSSNSPLAMSLNANNSPMYEFGGYSVDKDDLKFAEVANSGTMSVKVSAGLDGNEIIANTVRVYLWECDDKLKLKDGLDLKDPSTASYSSDNQDSAKFFEVVDNEQNQVKDLDDSKRVSTATYKISLPGNLAAGVHYMLTAGGEDVAGNKFYSAATYAFMVATAGDAPKVEFGEQFFINASAIDVGQSASYKAKIQITDKTGGSGSGEGQGTMQEAGNWVRVSLSLYKGYAKTKGYLNQKDLLQALAEIEFTGDTGDTKISKDGAGEYSVELPMNKFVLTGAGGKKLADNYTVALEVQAKNSGATSERTTYIFWADATPPALEPTAPARKSKDGKYYICKETDGKEILDITPQGAASKSYAFTPSGKWSDVNGSGTCELWYALTGLGESVPAINPTWTEASGAAQDGVTYYKKQGGGEGSEGLYLADTGIKEGDSVVGKYTLSLGDGWTAVKGAPKSSGNANWNAQIDSVLNSSGNALNVVAVDQTANFSGVQTISNIMFDFADPKIDLPAITPYYKAASLSLAISVDESSDMSELKVTATKDGKAAASGTNGYTLTRPEPDDKKSATLEFNGGTSAASDGKWNFVITATDKAERSSVASFDFTIDTVAPARQKDAQDRWITIGSDSSDAEWQNSDSLAIHGKFDEKTSGLSAVEYTLTPAGSTDTVTGSEALGGAVTTIGQDKKPVYVSYTISPIGFKDGTNHLTVKGVDQAGNSSSASYDILVDSKFPTISAAWYTYADTSSSATTPVTADDLEKAELTVLANGKTNMTVYGALEEKESGVGAVTIVINNAVVSQNVKYTKSELTDKASYVSATWSEYDESDNKAYTGYRAVISKDYLKTAISGNEPATVYVVAEDKAKNSTKQKGFMIQLDDEDPTAKIESPDASDSVYGEVAFSGTASDNQSVGSVKAYWSLNGEAKIDTERATNPDHEILDDQDKPLLTGTYSWKIGGSETVKGYALSSVNQDEDKVTFVDGTEYKGTAKNIYIKILTTDKAANQSVTVKKYKVDPKNDRPKITLTTAELAAMSADNYAPYSERTISGTVEDDDGVKKFRYKVNGQEWTDITGSLENGSWSVVVPNDGKYAIKFEVTDKNGTVFTSTTGNTDDSNVYLSPIIAGKDATIETGDTNLYLMIDTNKPEYKNLVFRTSASKTGTYEPENGLDKLGFVGGKKKFVKINFDATDENGISAVKLTLNGVEYTGTVKSKSGDKYPCEISGIDVSKPLPSASYTAQLEITGGFADDKTKEYVTFAVDNTEPDIKMLSPDGNTVHGKVTVYGTVEETASGIDADSMDYALSLSATEKPAESDYTGIKGVGNTWFVYFDGALATETESHAKTFETYIIDQGVTTKKDIDDQVFVDIVPIYLWIKAEDDVGNVYEKPQLISFDPQGGRPTVTIGNPEADEATVGGEFKLYGGADCEEGEIKAVFLQMISEQHNTIWDYSTDPATVKYDPTGKTFGEAKYSGGKVTKFKLNANDLDYLKAAGYKVYKMRDYPTDSTAADYASKLAAAEWKGSGTASDYGVVTDFKGSAWSQNINALGEFNPESGKNQLVVCAYAYNGSKFNLEQYRQMYVDADSPIIESMYLKRYNGSAVESSKAYTSGVYVKGANYLEFDLKDKGEIAKVYIGTGSDANKAKADAKSKKDSGAAWPSEVDTDYEEKDGYKVYHGKISLDTASGVGSVYRYVLFYDEEGHEGQQAFAVNYDNVNPVVSVESSASSKGISGDVHNSNNFYAVEGKVTENAEGGKNQSGFDRFVVYFKRGNKVYDPMISKKKFGSENPDNWIDVSGMTKAADGLYWQEKTVTRSAENLLTLSDGDTSAHIHAGRLVKMEGVVYKIKSVTSDGKTITLYDNVDTGVTTAYFAYGDSIDNNKKETGNDKNSVVEGYGCGYPTSIANDDYDGMEEWANIQGTVCNFSAKINSRNIPDGSIEICWTAFDKAGNFTSGSVTSYKASDGSTKPAYVSNNAPRLAKVTVASDFNFDGVYGDDESREYTPEARVTEGTAWDKAWSELTLGSKDVPFIAAKGAVKVTPEVLGGNGQLTWSWTYPTGDSGRSAIVTETDDGLSTDTPVEENKTRSVKAIELPAAKLALASTNAENNKYEVFVLDNTEGGAQKAVINLHMKNDVNDVDDPVAKTKRFFWKSLTNNSVYGSSSAQSQSDLQGHIELEEEFPNADGSAGKTKYETPKVSGKIVIKGTAFDNAGIGSIKIAIPGILNAATTVATCDFTKPVSSRWTKSSSGSLAEDGYQFALDAGSERYTNMGHFVSWTLYVDTEKAKFGANNLPAKTGAQFILSVVDKKGNKSYGSDSAPVYSNTTIDVYATDDQADAGKFYAEPKVASTDAKAGVVANADYTLDEFKSIDLEHPKASGESGVNKYEAALPASADYTMDIVPYITKAATSLSVIDATNGVADRSSLGHYPIYVYKNSTDTATNVSAKTPDKTETVTIYGFNLKGALYGSTALADSTANSGTLTSGQINPGAFSVTVNGVASLNNNNNNNAKGSYTSTATIAPGGTYSVYKNYINRQPNNVNNNNLDDDIYFDVWQLNDNAAAPISGNVDDPQMKINPVGGKIGFAFANGSNAFSMPNSTYSWTYWAWDYQGARYTALNYDPAGYAWAAAVGQDTSNQGGDSFFIETNHWREHGGFTGTDRSNHVDGHNYYHDLTKLAWCKLERLCIDRTVMPDRIQSPSIATTKNGVYMAYYDDLKSTIRYKAGDASAGYTINLDGSDDHKSGVWANPGIDQPSFAEFNTGFFKDEARESNMSYSEANVQIAVGKGNVDSGRGKTEPYVCIAAINGGDTRANDVVVMVWNDGSAIKYMYTTSDPMKTVDSKLSAEWSEPIDAFNSKVSSIGSDTMCQVAVDKNKGVHIAAATGSEVWYSYLSSVSATPKVARVDSYGATGESLTLDAALDASGNPAPQIGYYSASSSRPKYARWNSKKGSLADDGININGTDDYGDYDDTNDSYTGNWEVTSVPTASEVRVNDTANKVKQNINVGVWKNASTGRIANSTVGNSFTEAVNNGIDTTVEENCGDVYGNGSNNAVLSYMRGSTSAAYIETAQRVGDYDN